MLRYLTACLLFVGLTAVASQARMPCVIRVAGPLAYVDVGTRQAAHVGDVYVVLRQTPSGYAEVARVGLIRLSEQYSIAEVLESQEGEELQVLQWAVPLPVWDEMRAAQRDSLAQAAVPVQPWAARRRWVHVVAGGEWGLRTADMGWQRGSLSSVGRSNGVGAGLRLGYALTRRWRLSLTGRVGVGGDVRHTGLEADLQLVPWGLERLGPYLGAGAGLHLLGWEAPPGAVDSVNRAGANLMAGLHLPAGLPLFLEAGYQRVARWDDLLDVSHLRTYAGIGQAF
ncbi:MAG: hypothetical protein AB1505_04320 [Candidatus Latescibacterota bacterium]